MYLHRRFSIRQVENTTSGICCCIHRRITEQQVNVKCWRNGVTLWDSYLSRCLYQRQVKVSVRLYRPTKVECWDLSALLVMWLKTDLAYKVKWQFLKLTAGTILHRQFTMVRDVMCLTGNLLYENLLN